MGGGGRGRGWKGDGRCSWAMVAATPSGWDAFFWWVPMVETMGFVPRPLQGPGEGRAEFGLMNSDFGMGNCGEGREEPGLGGRRGRRWSFGGGEPGLGGRRGRCWSIGGREPGLGEHPKPMTSGDGLIEGKCFLPRQNSRTARSDRPLPLIIQAELNWIGSRPEESTKWRFTTCHSGLTSSPAPVLSDPECGGWTPPGEDGA